MNNYKIKVNTPEESKEAQELFFELGCYWYGCRDDSAKVFCSSSLPYPRFIQNNEFGRLYYCEGHHSGDEITLTELRDMVVLKRNCIEDATHENSMLSYIKLTDGWYYFDNDMKKWLKSTGGKPEYFDKLKPIEKNMKKEYLFKQISGDYKLVDHDCQGRAIEIPEGADCLTSCNNVLIFWKGQNYSFDLEDDEDWVHYADGSMTLDYYSDFYKENGVVILWQRPTQPEDLPFIDDEPMTMENQIKHSDKEMFDKIRNGDIKLDFSQFDQDDSEKGSTLITVPLIDDAPAGDKKIYTHDELNRMSDDDVVNHPNHYTQGRVECIDALEAATVGKTGIEAVCVANVIKYLWRYEEKNGKEDIKKAQWYLNKLLDSID